MTTYPTLPDWSNIRKGEASSALQDMGELAVRLGSVDAFDRGGDVVWMETFEWGITRWVPVYAGTGSGVTHSCTYFDYGGFSCYLEAGEGADGYAYIYHRLPLPALHKWGLECAFSIRSGTDRFRMRAIIRDGTHRTEYGVEYDDGDEVLRYLDENDAWVAFATDVEILDYPESFWHEKLIFDHSLGKYDRFIFGDSSYDMSAYTPYSEAEVSARYAYLEFGALSAAGGQSKVYMDTIIFTQNEQ